MSHYAKWVMLKNQECSKTDHGCPTCLRMAMYFTLSCKQVWQACNSWKL